MRVLFVLSELPFPASRNGIALINHEVLRRAPAGVDIDLLITGIDEPQLVPPLRAIAPALGQVTFTGEPLTRKYRIGNLLSGIVAGRNLLTQIAVRRYLESHREAYDAIYASPLMTGFDLRLTRPLFLNAVDSFAQLNESFYLRSGRRLDKLKVWLYRIYEARVLKQASLVNFVGSSDLAGVQQRNPALPLVNISNGVDSDAFHPAEERRVRGRILFTGNFDYAPNAQAALHLAIDIFPRILAARPDATLQIVGRNPPAALTGRPGVLTTGFVDDIVACYQAAEVFACPLLSGAGVKNKVLEALSCALPIVASSLAVSSIDHLQEGRHYLLADDSEKFAQHVLRVLEDGQLRRMLSVEARTVAVDRLGWQPIAERYFQGLIKVSEAPC